MSGKESSICRYYNTPSGCSRGNRCAYKHEKQDQSFKKASKRNTVCRYYNTADGCKRGDKCLYIHEKLDNDSKTQEPTEQKQNNDSNTNITNTGYIVNQKPHIEPIARILLMGVYDDNNIWSCLRGIRQIVQIIWEFALSFNKIYWKQFIETHPKKLYFKPVISYNYQVIKFPDPKNIMINMMPFIMSYAFENSKLPLYLKPYWPLINLCMQHDLSQINKIGFLTVDESVVDAGRSQRRPGLHTECPGNVKIKGGGSNDQTFETMTIGWAGGENYTGPGWKVPGPMMQKDGIYMASSIDDSCAAWNCKIIRDVENNREVIGHLGDIEHLRSNLPADKKQVMKANCMYWLTDRTPHEALGMNKKIYRQFFRLVTHKVSIWYEMHSTKNPNGVLPDSNITRIIKDNKFESKPKIDSKENNE